MGGDQVEKSKSGETNGIARDYHIFSNDQGDVAFWVTVIRRAFLTDYLRHTITLDRNSGTPFTVNG